MPQQPVSVPAPPPPRPTVAGAAARGRQVDMYMPDRRRPQTPHNNAAVAASSEINVNHSHTPSSMLRVKSLNGGGNGLDLPIGLVEQVPTPPRPQTPVRLPRSRVFIKPSRCSTPVDTTTTSGMDPLVSLDDVSNSLVYRENQQNQSLRRDSSVRNSLNHDDTVALFGRTKRNSSSSNHNHNIYNNRHHSPLQKSSSSSKRYEPQDEVDIIDEDEQDSDDNDRYYFTDDDEDSSQDVDDEDDENDDDVHVLTEANTANKRNSNNMMMLDHQERRRRRTAYNSQSSKNKLVRSSNRLSNNINVTPIMAAAESDPNEPVSSIDMNMKSLSMSVSVSGSTHLPGHKRLSHGPESGPVLMHHHNDEHPDEASVELDTAPNSVVTADALSSRVRRAVSALRSISFQQNSGGGGEEDVDTAWGQAITPSSQQQQQQQQQYESDTMVTRNGLNLSKWRRATGAGTGSGTGIGESVSHVMNNQNGPNSLRTNASSRNSTHLQNGSLQQDGASPASSKDRDRERDRERDGGPKMMMRFRSSSSGSKTKRPSLGGGRVRRSEEGGNRRHTRRLTTNHHRQQDDDGHDGESRRLRMKPSSNNVNNNYPKPQHHREGNSGGGSGVYGWQKKSSMAYDQEHQQAPHGGHVNMNMHINNKDSISEYAQHAARILVNGANNRNNPHPLHHHVHAHAHAPHNYHHHVDQHNSHPHPHLHQHHHHSTQGYSVLAATSEQTYAENDDHPQQLSMAIIADGATGQNSGGIPPAGPVDKYVEFIHASAARGVRNGAGAGVGAGAGAGGYGGGGQGQQMNVGRSTTGQKNLPSKVMHRAQAVFRRRWK